MAEFDELEKQEEDDELTSKVSKKKILLFLLPVLIAIGIAVGLYHTFQSSFNETKGLPYNIIEQDGNNTSGEKQTLIFYDLPEIETSVKNINGKSKAKFKLSIELTNKEDISKIEALLPRFYDIILSHIQELHTDEVNGAEGLYWLKEELLYRLNLAAMPIKISNINFKYFDIDKK